MNRNLDLWRNANWPLGDFPTSNRFMERFFDEAFPAGKSVLGFTPKFELSESDTAYTATFELPGMKKEQIKIDLHDNTLTVSGERKEEKKDEKKQYTEFSYGSFSRRLALPTAVDPEKVSAVFEQGVLTINLAKSGRPGSRAISIK